MPNPPAFPDVIEHLMPFGSITTLSGASGVGKTAFLASMIAAIQRGEPLFGQKTTCPPAIGILACDRPWRDHNAWFQKAGCGDLPHVSLRDEEYQWQILRNRDQVHLIFGKLVDRIGLPPGSLLIVDPVPLFIPGRLIDYKDMAIGTGLLDQQLKPRQLTALGVFHVSKQKGNKNERYLRPQDRILGSSALIGYSETAFYLISPEEAERRTYEFGVVSHQLPSTAYHYTKNDQGLFVPAEYFDGVQEEEAALALLPTDAVNTLSTATWAAQIMKACGISLRSAERLIRELRHAGRAVRVGRGLYRRALPC